MTIDKALEHLKFDVRLIEYHMNNGVIQKADLDKHLKELPDCSDNIDMSSDKDEEIDEEEIVELDEEPQQQH